MAPKESATESNALEVLLNPDCGIPFDVYFDIEDEAGTKLGTFGCHKNILALKSPVFNALWLTEGNKRPHQDQSNLQESFQDDASACLWCGRRVASLVFGHQGYVFDNRLGSEIQPCGAPSEDCQACWEVFHPKGEVG